MIPTEPQGEYQVVARKYRPQSFQGLIGQSHISTALSNAITQNRIGHAYLFTGARGVGKTSSARIFAKCLNCAKGPTIEPCNECDLCQAISIGEDIDVLEIDGASNRGIDEIRQLRSNVSIRPSRGRFKIYIIDEVHMLTTPAFNALLKTLEEPPAHVKFIFCTTDPHKIPITVLSRCQRFDFSPVQTGEIAQSLTIIASAEGIETDADAVLLLARRANGSMRDSQSLLEQLFSFCDGRITVAMVNQLLGTADTGRISQLATALIEGQASQAIGLINQAALDGVDVGQFARQLLGFFRDLMAIKIGCEQDTLLSCAPSEINELQVTAQNIGLETILSVMQLIDAAVVKMQHSLHARTLLEMAAVRICSLQNLDSLADLVDQIATGSIPTPIGNQNRAENASSPDAVNSPPTVSAAADSSSPANDSSKKKINEPWPVQGSNPRSASPQLDSNRSSETTPIGMKSGSVQQDHLSLSPHAMFCPSESVSAAKSSSEIMTATTSVIDHPRPAASPQGVHDLASSLVNTVANAVAGPTITEKMETKRSQAVKSSTGPRVATDPTGSIAPNVGSDAANKAKSAVEPLSQLTAWWTQMINDFGGLTAEMLADYESLTWAAENRVIAVLKDDYKIQECSKPEKKKRAETLLSEAIGRSVTIELRVSANQAKREKDVIPRLSRAQEMRMLQGNELVQQAMTTFDAEIVGFYRPQTKPKF